MPCAMRSSLFIAALFAPMIALAQVGTNTSCATAIELEVSPTNVSQELIPMDGNWYAGAVPAPATECSGSSAQSITAWFKFTATATKHWVRGEGQGTSDERMEVFSGSCGSLTSIACYPPDSPIPALTGLSIGNTYYLRVQMTSVNFCQTNSHGACQVWLGVISAPPHDDCPGAIELPVVSGSTQVWPGTEVSSRGATQSQAACNGAAGGANDDVWYRFTATAGAHFLPSKSLNGVQDNVFQWFSGSCGSLTSLGCDVDLMTGLTPGTPYYIRTYSESADANIAVQAVVDVLAPAPNDECAGAMPVEVTAFGEVPKSVSFSTINTTSSTVPCGTEQHDAWLRFTAPGPSAIVVVMGGGNATLFSGSCGSLTCVAQGTGLLDGFEFTGLTAGTEYYLKIGRATVIRANHELWIFAPGTNDVCATAIELEVQGDPAEFTQGHLFNTNEDAWYRFTATSTRHLLEGYSTAGEAQLPIRARVYSGACGGQTQVATSNDVSVPLAMNGLVVGETYYVNMWATGEIAFRVAVRSGMANDECSGAIELPYNQLDDFRSILRVTNTMATNGTGGCLPDRDVWFRFTAAHSTALFMAAEANIATSALVDAAIELFQGDCGSLTSISCVQDLNLATFTALVPGESYYIRWSTRVPTFYRPMLFDQPVNDHVAGALPAPASSTFAQGAQPFRSYAATQSLPAVSPCAGGGPDDDTWFTFIATAPSHTVLVRQGNLSFIEEAIFTTYRAQVYDTVTTDLAVLQGHSVGCGTSPLVLNGLEVGRQYLYRAYNSVVNSTSGFFTSVSVGNNDEATGAHPLTYTDSYAAIFNTAGATQSMPGAACQVVDHADDDIWFKFTATNAPARIVVGDATANVTIELFSGTPGNLTSIACDGNILVLPALTNGQTYHFRVYSWNNAAPVEGRIGLLTSPSLLANSCVDEECLGPVLVPNPGIEQGEHCFIHISEVDAIDGLGTVVAPGWPRMQTGSSDAWSSCGSYNSGRENPGNVGTVLYNKILSRNGQGMDGLYMSFQGGAFNYVEYLQAPLAEPLVPGEAYLVSFHAATNPISYCLSGLGAALSEGPLVSGHYDPIPIQPAVVSLEAIRTENWTNICGIYVPTSPVDHITIGAFQQRGEAVKVGAPDGTSYYVIDDVVVAHIDDASCITSIGDVPPLDEQANGEGDDLRVYPNPANDRVNIVCGAGLFGERAVIEVFDITGKRVYAEEVSHLQVLQPLELAADWKEGLYLVMVRAEGLAPKSARVVVRR